VKAGKPLTVLDFSNVHFILAGIGIGLDNGTANLVYDQENDD
jgi:hypothetical protein